MIVVQTCEDAISIVKFNFRGGEIYSLHALGAATYAGEHLAERSSSGVDVDGGSGDIGEERMKDHVVFAVEEENLTLGSV
jgi:hypothetical protein